jgi:hypothetical protein
VLVELWVVATRPTGENGLGMEPAAVQDLFTRFSAIFSLLPESPDTFARWQELVVRYGVCGKNAHDARLVAAMLVHGLSHVLTFNGKDFARFSEITVIAPDQLSTPSAST